MPFNSGFIVQDKVCVGFFKSVYSLVSLWDNAEENRMVPLISLNHMSRPSRQYGRLDLQN